MSLIDALYFSTETIATVGYGDFSFVDQPTWLRLFGIVLMFAGVTTTAVLMAFVADLLLSRRIGRNAGRRKVRDLRDHVIVVGLGSFGIRVVADLKAAGHDVVVIERNADNRFLSSAAELGVPVIFGDATLRQTLESARIDEAVAVAVLTHDDMVNIETGIVLREIARRAVDAIGRPARRAGGAAGLRPRTRRRRRASLRIRERAVHRRTGARRGSSAPRWACRCSARFRWASARSWSAACTSSRAANSTGCAWPSCPPRPGSSRSSRLGQPTTLHPRRDTRLTAGDTAYLVGPYRELLDTLRKGQRSARRRDHVRRTVTPRQVERRAVGSRRGGQPAVRSVLGSAQHGATVVDDDTAASRPRRSEPQKHVPVRRRPLRSETRARPSRRAAWLTVEFAVA